MESFEEQFNRPQTISFGISEIQVWDLNPNTGTNLPVVFVPGWAASPRPYKDALKLLFDSNRRIITLWYPPHIPKISLGEAPTPLSSKAIALLEIIKQKNLLQFDAIGYSEGCTILLLAMQQNETLFRNLVLEAPPGISGKESYFKIVMREFKNMKDAFDNAKTATPEEKIRIQSKNDDVKKWINEIGLVRTLEGMSPGRFDTAKILEGFIKSPIKHEVSIIAGTDDKMIDLDKLTAVSKKIGVQNFFKVIGGHQVFEVKATECASLAIAALQAMAK